jgi:hypothetical protein
VVETARLNETQVAEHFRKRGLYPEQIIAWRTVCEQATDREEARSRTIRDLTQGGYAAHQGGHLASTNGTALLP